MKTIQMIMIDDINSLFITGFNPDTNELEFRTVHDPRLKHKEIVKMDKDNVYTNLYYFNIQYLQKYLKENERNS